MSDFVNITRNNNDIISTYTNNQNDEGGDEGIASLVASLAQKAQQADLVALGINAVTQGFKGNGTTADLQLLNNLITTAPANSKIIIPNGTYQLNGALATLNNGVQIIGIGKPTFDFSTAPDGTTCVNINSTVKPSPIIENLIINGNSKTGTSTGLSITGDSIHCKNIEIKNFGTGLNLSHSNTYILSFERLHVHLCNVGIQFPDGSLTNCGENIQFYKCNISDNTTGFQGGLTTTDTHFYGCSIDYNVIGCLVKNGFYNFYGGHIETNSTTTATDYYFNVAASTSPSFSFHGTDIACYGLHNFLNPDTSLRGFASFYGVNGYGRATGAGSDSTMKSEQKVVITAGQTTATVNNFLANSQFSMISVKCYIVGGQSADITTQAITPTVKLTTGTNTLTITIPSQSSNVFVMVHFG